MTTDVFYFSAVDFEFLTQRPQQLFNEWSTMSTDHTFYYVEPFRRGLFLPRTGKIVRPSFYFYFTKYGMPRLESVNKFFVERLAKRTQGHKRVAIACTSLWEPYIDRSTFDFICYDYLDALEVHSGAANYSIVKQRHERLMAKSDIIFVTAEKLREEVRSVHPDKKVVTVANGVDCDFFTQRRGAMVNDYARADRKVVGYVGAIADWIDLELVHATARLTPELDYVFVGPVMGKNVAVTKTKPDNVFYLGAKAYDSVPSYIDLFDIALIPFVKSNISESTDPIKLYEYFALGKPVVATPMLQLSKFNDRRKLAFGETPAAFAEEIRHLLQNDDEQSQCMRQEVARDNSWASKASVMLESIREIMQGNETGL